MQDYNLSILMAQMVTLLSFLFGASLLLTKVIRKASSSNIVAGYICMITSLILLMTELLVQKILFRILHTLNYEHSIYYSYHAITLLNLIFGILIFYLGDRSNGRELGNVMLHGESKSRRIKFFNITVQVCFWMMFLWEVYLVRIFDTLPMLQDIALLCFCAFTIFILIYLNKMLKLYTLGVMEAALDQKYKDDLKDFIMVLRAQKHDFNFHIESLLGMIEAQEYQACKNYLQSMLKETKSIAEVMPLKDPAVSALLNTMKEAAAMKGIKVHFFIYYDMARISCSVYEINKVLGNLIQNAIDEVEDNAPTDSWIQVTILEKRNQCIIRVTNPVKDPQQTGDRFFHYGYSTKKNHTGIGLNSVMRIVTAYNGTVFPEFEENTVTFIAQIPLSD